MSTDRSYKTESLDTHQVPEKAPPPVSTKSFYMHKIRWSGENYSILSKWYTGSYENWQAIARANPHVKPTQISIGDNILIPENLLKTRDPMPYEYLENASSSQKTAPSSPAPSEKPAVKSKDELLKPPDKPQATPKPDEIELFEPQDEHQKDEIEEKIELFEPKGLDQEKSEDDKIELYEPKDAGIGS